MIPIVDSHAVLDGGVDVVQRYLSEANQVHVLRMVAVQQANGATDGAKSLLPLQKQSETRGLNGFPNAILGQANLYNVDSVSQIVNQAGVEKLKGVHHSVGTHESNELVRESLCQDAPNVHQSLSLLQEHNLSLDISGPIEQCSMVSAWADDWPDLTIAMNLSLANLRNLERDLHLHLERLKTLAARSNVYVKVSGAGLTQAMLESCLETVVSKVHQLFGDERLLFGTGKCTFLLPEYVTYDQLWLAYDRSCGHFTSRARDNFFRSNAVRVYQL